MDKEDSQNSIWDQIKSIWKSMPELIKLIGTILSIALAAKALFPAAAVGITIFDAGPEIIEPGGSSVLNWDVSGANNITIEPGIGAVGSNGSISVSPAETTTYKLIAAGGGKEKIALCSVTVNEGSQEPLIISSFDVSPDSITPGESAVLNWHVTGVSNVTIEPDIGVAEHTGTLNISPASTTTYKLTASNGIKGDSAYCTVAVEENAAAPENAPVSELPEEEGESLPSQENSVPQDDSTPEDDSVSQDSSTPQDNSASQEDSASQDNPALKENQVSQGSLPAIVSFNANPDTIGKGESTNLIWSVSGASKVSIEPGIGNVGLTGSQRIFLDETTTYTLTASNELGSTDATKVILVQESSAPVPQESGSTPSPEVVSTPEEYSPADEIGNNSTSALEFSQNGTQ